MEFFIIACNDCANSLYCMNSNHLDRHVFEGGSCRNFKLDEPKAKFYELYKQCKESSDACFRLM